MPVHRMLGSHRPPGHTEETAAHRTISYPLAHAHIADLRQRAQRNTLARAARRVRPGRVAARQALQRASASLVA